MNQYKIQKKKMVQSTIKISVEKKWSGDASEATKLWDETQRRPQRHKGLLFPVLSFNGHLFLSLLIA